MKFIHYENGHSWMNFIHERWHKLHELLYENVAWGLTINTNSTNYLVDILSSQGLFLLVDNVGQLKTPIGHHHFVTTTILKFSWGKTSPNLQPEKHDFNLYKGLRKKNGSNSSKFEKKNSKSQRIFMMTGVACSSNGPLSPGASPYT
jgi:hypothetical protein